MASKATVVEPNLPWLDNHEDRNFKRLVMVMLVLFIAGGVVLNSIQLPEVVQKNLVDVSPRLAKLILEKKKIEPPPKPQAPPPKKEAVEKKKEPPKPEKKKEVKKESAREVAKKSGLIAELDELEDMREMFNLDDLPSLPQQTGGKEAVKVASTSALLSAGAQRSSGGIQTDTLNRNLQGSELAQRQTSNVQSKIRSSDTQLAKATTGQQQQSSASSGGKRSADEIERVFQKNKGAIFNIYNRALRQNPSLAGQVVVELTIAPGGEVTAVNILSSELDDAELERKLQLRIKRFKFSNANVAEITVTYPIDFLPS
jgi:periplasmic protein TonB